MAHVNLTAWASAQLSCVGVVQGAGQQPVEQKLANGFLVCMLLYRMNQLPEADLEKLADNKTQRSIVGNWYCALPHLQALDIPCSSDQVAAIINGAEGEARQLLCGLKLSHGKLLQRPPISTKLVLSGGRLPFVRPLTGSKPLDAVNRRAFDQRLRAAAKGDNTRLMDKQMQKFTLHHQQQQQNVKLQQRRSEQEYEGNKQGRRQQQRQLLR